MLHQSSLDTTCFCSTLAADFYGFPSQDYMIARNAEQTEVADKKASAASTFRPFRSTKRYSLRPSNFDTSGYVKSIQLRSVLMWTWYDFVEMLLFASLVHISHVSSGWWLRHAASMQFGGSESEGEGDSRGLIQRSSAWTPLGWWKQLWWYFMLAFCFQLVDVFCLKEIPVTLLIASKLCAVYIYL